MFGLKAREDFAALFKIGISSSINEFAMLGVDLDATQNILHPETGADLNYLRLQEDKPYELLNLLKSAFKY